MLSRLITLSAAMLASVAAYGAVARAGAWPVWVVAIAVGVAAAARPPAGVMLVAALAPLGGAIAALAGLQTSATEPLLLTVLAGWLWRRVAARERWDSAIATLAGLFALVVLTSLLTQCALAYQLLAVESVSFPRALLQWLTATSSALEGPFRPEVISALRLIGGLGLFVMTVEVGRHTPAAADSALRLLTLGVAGVATLSISRFAEIVLRQGGDLMPTALEFHRFVRISSTIADVNAAGLMFALILPAAAAQCLEPRRRFVSVMALAAIGAGLWLTGSRAGMVGGAVGLMAYLGLLAWRRWTPARVALAGIVGCVVLAGVVSWYPRGAAHATATDAWLIRKYLAITSVEMARSSPLFGVGIGRFRAESGRFAPAGLFRYYAGENAHNQVLQLLGELGLLGAGLFLALLACSLVPEWRSLGHPTSNSIRAPVVLGVFGWLLASLLQHPLLVPEVSAAFWLALGLARSTVAVAPVTPEARRTRLLVTAVAATILLVSLPSRVAAMRNGLNLDGVGVNLSAWRRDDARRYRVATSPAALYIDGHQGRLLLPLRVHRSNAPSVLITLMLDNRLAGRIALDAGEWREFTILLPPQSPRRARFRRLELRWPSSPGSQLRIGRESYSGSGPAAQN